MKSFYCLYTLLLTISLSLISQNVIGQYDTIHYMPPLFAVENIGLQSVYLSTSETSSFLVTTKDGDGNIVNTVNISKTSPQSIALGQGYNSRGPISKDSLNTILTYNGLILSASQPFFVNFRHKESSQGLSLTTKGTKALGTIFRTGHVYNNTNIPKVKGHTISVMATEDNTQVTFTDINPGVVFFNTQTAGTPLTSEPITVILDKWESYVIGTKQDDPIATNNQNDVNGTLIVTDKNVAVNTGSWLAGGQGSSRDIGVDQIVPYQLIGNEYIFVQGNGTANTERPLVVAISDSTVIFINNDSIPYITLNAGEHSFIPESKFTVEENMYVYGNNDFYMYQTMSGSNVAAVGMIFIPPLSCIGGDEVSIPEVEQLGVSTISITGIVGSPVYVNGSSTPLPNPSPVSGNPDWVTYKIQNLTGNVTVSSMSKINVALLTTEGVRGAAGYFSGFRPSIETVDNTNNYLEILQPSTKPDTIKLNQEGPFTELSATFLQTQNGGSITFGTPNLNEVPYAYVPGPNYVGYDYVTLKICKDFICANGSMVSNCINHTVTIRVYGPENCENGLDDDQDGLDDCSDGDCTPINPAKILLD